MRPVLAALIGLSCAFAVTDDAQFNGGWDITVSGNSVKNHAWWLEVTGAGTDNVRGKFVGSPGGQIEDIPKISILDNELRFVVDRKNRRDQKTPQKGLYWARLEGGTLKGTFEIEGDPSSYLEWTGVRAPALPDKDDGTWKRGDPVPLVNGHDLTGWQPTTVPGPHTPAWNVKDGVLVNSPGAPPLASDKKFWNFDLHVEYMLTQRSNGGIGLRGRYELQLTDDFGDPPSKRGSGAIFGRIAPRFNASKPAGEWQWLDVRLIGRQVSVTLNGLKVIEKATIEGLTGIGDDPNEGDPGPITLQDDVGTTYFHKIVVYPLTKAH